MQVLDKNFSIIMHMVTFDEESQSQSHTVYNNSIVLPGSSWNTQQVASLSLTSDSSEETVEPNIVKYHSLVQLTSNVTNHTFIQS